MSISDAELRDYLEGRLDADASKRIETAMLADATLERRLMAMDDLAADVRDAMGALPDDGRVEPIAAAMAPAPPVAAPRNWRWAGFAAACLVGIGIGWGGSLLTPKPADWRVEVAHYQALYTGDTIDGIAVSADAIEAQLTRAGAMVGADLPRDALASISGMELMRAQILGFSDRPLAQIVYRGPGDAPIALCLIRTGGADAETSIAEMQGLASASWSANGVEYLLIGGDDADWIAARAAEARAALAGA